MLERRGIIVHPEELDNIWLDEIGKTQINVLGLHPVGGQRAAQSLAEAVERHKTASFEALLAKAQHMNLTVEYEAHALGYLLPRDLFLKHPEWFRMDEKGERVADCNLCPSNEEALAQIESAAENLTIQLNTGSHRHFWWADDVAGKGCHCPLCKNLTPSDQLMRITNAIHRGVRKADPQGCTAYLAYLDTLCPPRQVEPEEGVFLEYAPIKRDIHRPINDASCEQNLLQSKPLKELLAFFGTKNAQVLEYWMDNSLFSGWKKPPKPMTLDEDVMKQDIDFYEGLGFTSITSFGCYLGADYRALYGMPPIQAYGGILAGVR